MCAFFLGVQQPSAVKIVCKKRDRGEWGERESFAPYYVTVVTPPPRNLGIHSLPPVSTISINHLIAILFYSHLIIKLFGCQTKVQNDFSVVQFNWTSRSMFVLIDKCYVVSALTEHSMWWDSGGQRGTIRCFRCNVPLSVKEGQVWTKWITPGCAVFGSIFCEPVLRQPAGHVVIVRSCPLNVESFFRILFGTYSCATSLQYVRVAGFLKQCTSLQETCSEVHRMCRHLWLNGRIRFWLGEQKALTAWWFSNS